VSDISHSRARTAALGGLIVQVGVAVGLFALTRNTFSMATFHLAWFTAGGVLIWLAALLVSRQRELTVLEQRDLEHLRREKQAVGADVSMFDSERGGAGFQVAETRLRWMIRWLVPVFSLVNVVYLIGLGVMLTLALSRSFGDMGSAQWPVARNVGLALVILAAVMFLLFLYSRYAAGMGRIAEWHLLRACGSYMLGNTLAAFALIVCLGLQLWDPGLTGWERGLAYAIPALMAVLGAETALNFVADIYRPRQEGVEPRAAFDSRLLGLLSEPGGFAHSIAEAVNYQFGFKVSQTWFYQLLARTFFPLVGVGLLILWLMSSVVVVQPFQRVVIERFGRLVDPDRPLEPGLHFKLPWPLSIGHALATGELHQIIIGAEFEHSEHDDPGAKVILWTDREHADDHFNFLVPIRPEGSKTREEAEAEQALAAAEPESSAAGEVGVYILRMSLAVQYKIDAAHVAKYMGNVKDPDDLVRNVAWHELVRFIGQHDVDAILGELRQVAGPALRDRINDRLAAFDLGIEVVYAGLQAVHPEATVAQRFEDVIVAEQYRMTRIRLAQVGENEVLSRVAGDKQRAERLSEAINHRDNYESVLNETEPVIEAAGPPAAAFRERLESLEPRFVAVMEAQLALDRARAELDQVELEYRLGMAGSPEQLRQDRARVEALAQV
jgi:regulator of protease activity HflC (stomatin/prohibitin superfamily)